MGLGPKHSGRVVKLCCRRKEFPEIHVVSFLFNISTHALYSYPCGCFPEGMQKFQSFVEHPLKLGTYY